MRHSDGLPGPAPDPLLRGRTSSRPLRCEVSSTAMDHRDGGDVELPPRTAVLLSNMIEKTAFAPAQADTYSATKQRGSSAGDDRRHGCRWTSIASTPLLDTGEEPHSSTLPNLGRRLRPSRYSNTERPNRAPELLTSHCNIETRTSKRSRRYGEQDFDRSTGVVAKEVNTAGRYSRRMKPHLFDPCVRARVEGECLSDSYLGPSAPQCERISKKKSL